MSRITTNRRLAEALLKTIRRLEADPSLDPQEPAFVHLKCTLLQRLVSLEVDTAETESSIHLVEYASDSREADPIAPQADSAIA